MPGTGKKVVIHPESGKCCFPKKETGSELIASLKLKKDSKISKSKKLKSKSMCHAKTISSTLLKRTVAESPSKGTKDDSGKSKLVSKKSRHKELEKKSSEKLGSSKHKGKETKKPVISKGNGDVANEYVETKQLKKRRKKKRQKEKVELDEASRLQRRTRYLLIKMKLEQNLIDAYSGEGWKGQSREKIKPERELQRAKKEILKCKLGIRDAIRQLDSLSSVGCIEGSVIAADGSVHHEHIICAKCKLREAFPDNDIVLCDGTCNCAFHQKCLDPPLDTESRDQGWFCRFCECKMEIIEAMNAHIGTSFSVSSNWQDIFKEEAAFPDGGSALLNQEKDWPSDDSEDDDYNPERESSCSITGAETDDDASSSTSLSWSSDDGALAETQRWEIEGNGYKNFSVDSSLGSDETSDGEVICGRRQRSTVDYKKLYDEMFGKDAAVYEQVSEDEDWGPAKRRRREKESDAVNTLMTLYGSEEKCSNVKTSEEKKKFPSDTRIRRPFFRIPANAVEKLRQVFAENELPSRVVKENLSKDLGLEPEKVNKWFKNARYIALKARKVERAKQIHNSPRISKESRLETEKKTTAEVVALKDDALKETLTRTPKSPKKIHGQKDSKSLSDSLKTNQHQRASVGSPVNNSNQASIELSDDMSLKKLLKAKPKKGKKANFVAQDRSQAAEAEMERLCRAKGRLENLKQKLSKLQSENARKYNENQLNDESVIYVPVAELREKV
ncbi:pathogenesis-related homeodomain protein-like [Melia azedarach]|uniref:Pathogenesis-related homeodomain protein-like n=1 Tax=Melia azedarach TaxID=155640 RepID=A0ACC1XD92_MELAZ|nr:pathogenesis-related homeodomain protein-like [Melia azedarach]